MIRKIICSLLFFSLLELFLYSCCESVQDLKISSVYFAVNDKSDFSLETINHNDLELFLQFNYENDFAYLLQTIKPLNVANATTCNEIPNVINRVTDIKITANNEFNGIFPGETLNALFKLKHGGSSDLEVEDILPYINNDEFDADDTYELVLSEEIIEGVNNISFKIALLLEDGQIIERNSVEVSITI